MNDSERVKNIVAFLSLIFGNKSASLHEIMDFSPEYLIEKFDRYVLSNRDESSWGLSPGLRQRVFNEYCKRWHLNVCQHDYQKTLDKSGMYFIFMCQECNDTKTFIVE